MEHVSTESSWPMTLRALGGPARSQSKCHTSRAPSISHSKEERPCTGDGKAGWVPTVFHSPTRTSKCFSELVGCGGRSACSFMFIPLVSALVRECGQAGTDGEVSHGQILPLRSPDSLLCVAEREKSSRLRNGAALTFLTVSSERIENQARSNFEHTELEM